MNVFRTIPGIGVRSIVVPRPQRSFIQFASTMAAPNGDLNNTSAERARIEVAVDPAYNGVSLAIPSSEDDPDIRKSYRPFLHDWEEAKDDWVAQLELSTALRMVELQVLKRGDDRLRVVVLYGSMRQRCELQSR
jgi:arsenic resistance protein ArsH